MNSFIIAYTILGVGFLGFLILVLRSKWLQTRKNINDYHEKRDALTKKKVKEEVEAEESGTGIGIGNLIGGFITLLVGTSLIGPVTEEINNAIVSGNLTTTADSTAMTMLSIMPIIFALVVLTIAVTMAASSLRKTGLI